MTALAELKPQVEYVDPRSLVTPRRYDLAVKWRLFRAMRDGGGNNELALAEAVYCWHIKTRHESGYADYEKLRGDSTLDYYVVRAELLCEDMAFYGFLPESAIPVDPNGELLGGAHRTACAIALGLTEVPIERKPQLVWAPPWDLQWFIDNGMPEADLERLKSDFEEMQRG